MLDSTVVRHYLLFYLVREHCIVLMYSHRSCIMLYLVLYIAVCFINSSVGNHVYYVIPTTGNQTCPTGQVCHDISYYATIQFTFPSTGNITLIFLEGQHILNYNLHILGQHSITFKGQRYDDHWSTVIYCSDGCTGIQINTPAVIRMERLTYINGSLELDVNDVLQYLYMHSMSFQNASVVVFANYVTITDSILDNTNCMKKCDTLFLCVFKSGNIHNLTIQGVTDNKIGFNGALSILCNNGCFATIKLTDVTIANNKATGIYIGNCEVKFGNVTISNNHSPFNGGGMRMDGTNVNYIVNHITSLPNTTVSFINNRAKGVGGAIYFDAMDTVGNSFLHFITIAFV